MFYTENDLTAGSGTDTSHVTLGYNREFSRDSRNISGPFDIIVIKVVVGERERKQLSREKSPRNSLEKSSHA